MFDYPKHPLIDSHIIKMSGLALAMINSSVGDNAGQKELAALLVSAEGTDSLLNKLPQLRSSGLGNGLAALIHTERRGSTCEV
jgi:hypothetical protein